MSILQAIRNQGNSRKTNPKVTPSVRSSMNPHPVCRAHIKASPAVESTRSTKTLLSFWKYTSFHRLNILRLRKGHSLWRSILRLTRCQCVLGHHCHSPRIQKYVECLLILFLLVATPVSSGRAEKSPQKPSGNDTYVKVCSVKGPMGMFTKFTRPLLF
jgi:hypothetical protein